MTDYSRISIRDAAETELCLSFIRAIREMPIERADRRLSCMIRAYLNLTPIEMMSLFVMLEKHMTSADDDEDYKKK